MRSITSAAVFWGAVLLASSATADVRLTIVNGQVTLSAKDATLRQILAEWARVGQTTFVNAEQVAGEPLTIELANVSEEQALDVILRSVSGYLAAPRSESIANGSRYDRVLVMPTSTGTRPSATPPPAFQQPQFNPPPIDDEEEEDLDEELPPQVFPNGVQPGQRRPIFNAFPPVQGGPRRGLPTDGATPAASPAPGSSPGVFATPVMPAGVAIPGMIVPAAPQPGQPGAPDSPQDPPQGD
ncbi:MAG: hypothetical protein GEU82_16955 [Luteitalea sp.]|nr:hypothetical protein [Luteitalea sp.]